MDPLNPNGHLAGQPCSTLCENLNNPDGVPAWNQVTGDGVTQQSLIYQIYNPATPLVGPHVVVFNGAYGGQTLSKWDPTPIGYYARTELTVRGIIEVPQTRNVTMSAKK